MLEMEFVGEVGSENSLKSSAVPLIAWGLAWLVFFDHCLIGLGGLKIFTVGD